MAFSNLFFEFTLNLNFTKYSKTNFTKSKLFTKKKCYTKIGFWYRIQEKVEGG